ncbi:MAG: signal peptidase I [Trueperaceae bacterium]
MSKKQVAESSLSPRKRFWREVKGYVEAIIIAVIVTTFLFTTVGVAGSSMAPTFEGGSGRRLEAFFVGDRLFVPKYETWLKRLGVGGYQRGDIIIFRELPSKPCRPGEPGRPQMLIKRLIGLAGDHVQVKEDGSVWINEVELDQRFITEVERGSISTTQVVDLVVPEAQFFAMGDNRPGSCDSRIYGTVPFSSIEGRASAVLWPPMRDGHLNWRGLNPPAAFQGIN